MVIIQHAWRLTVPEGHRFEATQALLRPSELFALERRGVDRAAGVVQVRRAYANGRVRHTNAAQQTRRPPAGNALEALAQLRPREDSPRRWKPVQKAAGIDPLRDLYDLRHTYATFALRAGVPVFALARFMGTSIAMIVLHYGHLAVDSHEHAVLLLDALALERAVDAWWMVDVDVRNPRYQICQKGLTSRTF